MKCIDATEPEESVDKRRRRWPGGGASLSKGLLPGWVVNAKKIKNCMQIFFAYERTVSCSTVIAAAFVKKSDIHGAERVLGTKTKVRVASMCFSSVASLHLCSHQDNTIARLSKRKTQHT